MGKQSDSECTLKGEPEVFADSNAECGTEEGSRITPRALGLSSWRDGVCVTHCGREHGWNRFKKDWQERN